MTKSAVINMFNKVRFYKNRRSYIFGVIKRIYGCEMKTCPLCGYEDVFHACGVPPRYDAVCPSCGALERHRLFALVDGRVEIMKGCGSVLHFAPEAIIAKYLRSKCLQYTSADFFNAKDIKENIENMTFSDCTFDIIFCSHVLEHVDDKKAIMEVYRVLKPGGKFITMVPICEGWDVTYENSLITSEVDKEKHFGQSDHVRYYGRDFVTRLEAAGFTVVSFTGTPEEILKYGLIRGEKIFLAQKEG